MRAIRPQLITLLFVLVPTILVGAALYFQSLPNIGYEFHDLKVEQADEGGFWFVPLNHDDQRRIGERFYASICRDYPAPAFASGMVLKKVIFVDEGPCWSLNPNKHAGYFIQRDALGIPIKEGVINGN